MTPGAVNLILRRYVRRMQADGKFGDLAGAMRAVVAIGAIAVSLMAAGPTCGLGQEASPGAPSSITPRTPAAPAASAGSGSPIVVGGTLHGVIKSGGIPLPGVAVTAANTLTGKRFATTTDITGA